jgi:hypothetical protein
LETGGVINVMITADELPKFPKTSLDDFVKNSKQYFENSVDNFLVEVEQNAEASGYPAILLTVTFNSEGMTVKQTHIYFIEDNLAFILAYTASPEMHAEYLPIFERMLGSFTFH